MANDVMKHIEKNKIVRYSTRRIKFQVIKKLDSIFDFYLKMYLNHNEYIEMRNFHSQ